MKSYLRGNPELIMILNDNIVLGRQSDKSSINAVVLDDCNFHESVNAKNFDTEKILKIIPPEGEFLVMNYRINSEFQPPFGIYPTIEEINNYKLQLIVKVKAAFTGEYHASDVLIKFAIPRQSASVSLDIKVYILYI